MDERSIDRETARLNVLNSCNLLDTEPEQAFDDIVGRAKALCDAPMALVTLIDKDRQWFKARIGIADRETSLEESVCSMAMRQGYLFQIADLAQDARTARFS